MTPCSRSDLLLSKARYLFALLFGICASWQIRQSTELFGMSMNWLSLTSFRWPTGLALKQLTDNEGRPYHANIRHNKRREKGRWLAETVKETMTSISMNEDLYDSDDDTPPPSALRKRNRTSMVGHTLGSRH